MKAVIKDVKFHKEYKSKYGMLYSHKVYYEDRWAFYSSKKKEQDKFIKGQEAEFTEDKVQGEYGPYYVIKPVSNNYNSNFGKALKREQSRYSGFAMSYAKDMVVAGIISKDYIFQYADDMFTWMVEKDKTLTS